MIRWLCLGSGIIRLKIHPTVPAALAGQAKLSEAEAERIKAAEEKEALLLRLAELEALLSEGATKMEAAAADLISKVEVVGKGRLAQQEEAQEVWAAVEGLRNAAEECEAQLQVGAGTQWHRVTVIEHMCRLGCT